MRSFYLVLLLLGLAASKPASKFKFFTNGNTTHVVKLGRMAHIDCDTDDQNAKVTLWKIDGGKRVRVVPGPNVQAHNGDFYINTFSNEAGQYQCEAEDNFGNKITRGVTLKINLSKKVLAISPVVYMSILTVITGDSFTLTCETTNIGRSILQWNIQKSRFANCKMPQLNSKMDYSVHEYPVGKTNIKKSVLNVYSARKQFSGCYTCRRVTPFGTVELEKEIPVKVIVLERPSLKKPSHEAKLVKVGSSTHLDCIVAGGTPWPTIQWKKDGKTLKTCTRIFTHDCFGALYLKTSRGLKIVSAVSPRDNGTYTCEASNKAGLAIKTFDVNVEAPPDLSKSPSYIFRKHKVNYDITCTDSQGNPPPKFTWSVRLILLNYKTPWLDVGIQASHRIYSKDLNSSTVTVPDFVNNAEYRCKAKNSLGVDTHVIKFQSSKRN